MKIDFERLDYIKLFTLLFGVILLTVLFISSPLIVHAERSGYNGKPDKVAYVYSENSVKKYDCVAVHGDLSHVLGTVLVIRPYPSPEAYYLTLEGYIFSDSIDLDCSWQSYTAPMNVNEMPMEHDFQFTTDDSRSVWDSLFDNGIPYYYKRVSSSFYKEEKIPAYTGYDYVVVDHDGSSKNNHGYALAVLLGHYPDGAEVVQRPEGEKDENLVIHNLESYENRDSVVTGLTTYVTWDALGGDTYNPADLYLEAKIDFTTQNKRTGEKQSYTGVPLRTMSDGVKDSSGKFSFVNYQFLSDYCADKGIDDTNLIYLTDNIYCRYAYDGQDGVVYGEWQRVGDVIPTIDDADYSQDLELENMTYKELHPLTGIYQHYVSFDIKDSYDDNTYLLVNADIKWKPALNKTNVATYIPIVEKNDKYLASSGEWSIDVDTLWKNYFDSEGINYSAFSSQWTDKLYFQVVKWSESDNKWYSSAIRYFDIKTQTTGTVGNEWHSSTGLIDKETGEFIEGGFDSSGTFVPGSGNGYFGDSTTGNITDKSYGGIFEGIDLPEGSSVLDYIMALGSALVSGIGSLLTSIGQVPKMIGSVLSFLPDSVITLIGLGIIVAIVLRVLGR